MIGYRRLTVERNRVVHRRWYTALLQLFLHLLALCNTDRELSKHTLVMCRDKW
ncbi:hypothetical protein D3C81_2335220 [compost metagenome]